MTWAVTISEADPWSVTVTNSITAAEVLAALKTVDGTGSGLDADLVRGVTPGALGLDLLARATLTAGALLYGAVGAVTAASLPLGSVNQVLTAGATAPQWSSSLDLAGTIRAKPSGTAGIQLDPNAATGDFTARLSPVNLTADRRHLLPNVDGTVHVRTLTGTANEITVTNGDGLSAAPTFSLPTALTFTGKTITGGTFTLPTLSITDSALTIQGSTTSKTITFEADTQAAAAGFVFDVGAQTASRRVTVQTLAAAAWVAAAGQAAFVAGRVAYGGTNGPLIDSAQLTFTTAGSASLTIGNGSADAFNFYNGAAVTAHVFQIAGVSQAQIRSVTTGIVRITNGGASATTAEFNTVNQSLSLPAATGTALTVSSTTNSVTPTANSVYLYGGIGIAGNVIADGQVIARAQNFASWRDTTPTRAGSFGHNSPATGIRNETTLSHYNGAAWADIVRSTETGWTFVPTALVVTVSCTTAASSVSTGAIVCAGGIGVAKQLNVGATSSITQTGASLQPVLNLNNLQAAAAGVGPYLQFQGDAAVAPMAAIVAEWTAASNADAHLDFYNRQTGTQFRRLRLTNTGHLLLGSTTDNAVLGLTAGTVTADTPVIWGTQTWNSGASTFTGWRLNVTDTASAAASLLLDLQKSATSQFSVTKSGEVNALTEYRVNGTRVVAARKTGWSTWTGTATRTSFDTSTATLANVAQALKALIDDLHQTAGHGLIGT